ncbi:hypothetical protein [Mycoplasmopsis verecunda]|uniref:Uncharacterized protein n=1 Tax=Mycoplasmopsis verecunda TaxID=171291 RepID=A0A1T4KS37_9BACT|nr:hypothetical protein [Mycoplasmopsis verecunda]WPB54682.1 hypothetical protein SAM46_00770 [Mycoplasmopsis verecunda]SJZ45158.1 hypothetical protein SAMN02745154_00150 [Mycoplasmopsis verecunda]
MEQLLDKNTINNKIKQLRIQRETIEKKNNFIWLPLIAFSGVSILIMLLCFISMLIPTEHNKLAFDTEIYVWVSDKFNIPATFKVAKDLIVIPGNLAFWLLITLIVNGSYCGVIYFAYKQFKSNQNKIYELNKSRAELFQLLNTL